MYAQQKMTGLGKVVGVDEENRGSFLCMERDYTIKFQPGDVVATHMDRQGGLLKVDDFVGFCRTEEGLTVTRVCNLFHGIGKVQNWNLSAGRKTCNLVPVDANCLPGSGKTVFVCTPNFKRIQNEISRNRIKKPVFVMETLMDDDLLQFLAIEDKHNSYRGDKATNFKAVRCSFLRDYSLCPVINTAQWCLGFVIDTGETSASCYVAGLGVVHLGCKVCKRGRALREKIYQKVRVKVTQITISSDPAGQCESNGASFCATHAELLPTTYSAGRGDAKFELTGRGVQLCDVYAGLQHTQGRHTDIGQVLNVSTENDGIIFCRNFLGCEIYFHGVSPSGLVHSDIVEFTAEFDAEMNVWTAAEVRHLVDRKGRTREDTIYPPGVFHDKGSIKISTDLFATLSINKLRLCGDVEAVFTVFNLRNIPESCNAIDQNKSHRFSYYVGYVDGVCTFRVFVLPDELLRQAGQPLLPLAAQSKQTGDLRSTPLQSIGNQQMSEVPSGYRRQGVQQQQTTTSNEASEPSAQYFKSSTSAIPRGNGQRNTQQKRNTRNNYARNYKSNVSAKWSANRFLYGRYLKEGSRSGNEAPLSELQYPSTEWDGTVPTLVPGEQLTLQKGVGNLGFDGVDAFVKYFEEEVLGGTIST